MSVSREEFDELKKQVHENLKIKKVKIEEVKAVKEVKETKEVKHREPTAYNLYMSKKIKEFRANNPDMTQKEVFSKATVEWKTSSENIRNQNQNKN